MSAAFREVPQETTTPMVTRADSERGGVLRCREDAVFAFDRLPEQAERLADAHMLRRPDELPDGANRPEQAEHHEQPQSDKGLVVGKESFLFSVSHLQNMYMSDTIRSSGRMNAFFPPSVTVPQVGQA